jgi:hypothetical protein
MPNEKLTLNPKSEKVQGKVKATDKNTFTVGGIKFCFPESLDNKLIQKGNKCAVVFEGGNGNNNNIKAEKIFKIDYPTGLYTIEKFQKKLVHATIVDNMVVSISISNGENLNFIFPN